MPRSMDLYLREGVAQTAFCPGCGHGILLHVILRAVRESELDMRRVLFVSGIGCAAWIPSPHIRADTLHTLHGRAVAYATGAKLANPDLTVIVVSGDGDLASIGGNHLIHAARRGIDLTVVCANNEIYGMTGGQVASTTRTGALSSTTPAGNPHPPFDLVRLVLASGAAYAARYPVTQPLSLVRAIRSALSVRGFSFVEAISPCPTQFGRRNRIDDIGDLYDFATAACVTREDAAFMTEADLRDRVPTGEWTAGDLTLRVTGARRAARGGEP